MPAHVDGPTPAAHSEQEPLLGPTVHSEHEPLLATSPEHEHKRSLRGWFSYAFAAEVFAVVSLTLFLPICLEQFARDNGYIAPKYEIPCADYIPPPNSPAGEAARCAVKLGWMWVDTASFSLYVFSTSVALQALTVISVGAIADQPSQRKPLLLTFAGIGAASTTAFILLDSRSVVWLLCGIFAILANIAFGTSMVALNAYLPDLAKSSPEVRKAWDQVQVYSASRVTSAPSLDDISPANKEAVAHYNKTLSRATSRISSHGIAIGYAAGIALLSLTLVPVSLMKGSTLSLRLAIGASGVWWGVFTLPAAYWLPAAQSLAPKGEHAGLLAEVRSSWARIYDMLRPAEIKKLRNTFWFLAAWFVLSDGFTTITGTAVLFAKTTLHLPAGALVIVGVLTPLAGILGSVLWPRLQRVLGWSNIRCMLALVLLASLIPAYGCLGFLSVFKRSPRHGGYRFGGLTTKEEMFGLALYFGSIYGAFQSYARAVYAEIIPRGEEARWFSLYSITDKSSSFIGPLCVGLIADATGNIRFGFFFIVIMMWLSVPVLLAVDVEQGRTDARRVSDERDGSQLRRTGGTFESA